MREKLRQIERVRNVRAMRERLSEASLAIAMAKLRDAEERLEEARQAEIAGAREAIAAMSEGERREWAMSMALRKAVTAVVCVATLASPVANALAVACAMRANRKKVVSLVTVTGPLVKVGGGYGQHPWGYLELRIVVQKIVMTGANGKVTV